MQDQVFALRQNGLRADYLNSSLSADETRRTEKKVLSGGVDLLYVAPERLLTDGFQQLLRQIPVALFCDRRKRTACRSGGTISGRSTFRSRM